MLTVLLGIKGCGRGYDVVMLALHGFDAYGLEISATGVAEAQKYAATEMHKPQDYNFGAELSTSTAPGAVTFIRGDFFKADWVSEAAGGQFDVIYDYTVSGPLFIMIEDLKESGHKSLTASCLVPLRFAP